MLTCDEVRERLPGIATGETAAPEVREHLATCDACRAERGNLVAEVDLVREGLASLAPSPFLEDAVVEAAAEAAAEAPRQRRWTYVGAAALAAAALLLVVILPRLDRPERTEGGGPADEESSRMARVGFPPSAAEVDAARVENIGAFAGRRNARDASLAIQRLHTSVLRSGERTAFESIEFLPADPQALHRYVYEDVSAQFGVRTHDVTSWPPKRGLLMLGLGMIEEIGGVLAPRGEIAIHLGDQQWRTTVGTSEGEITLGSPDANGAQARVRVHVSTGYSGTLLIEGPLARALGLHQFEIPGGVRFASPEGGTIPVFGQRARARVAIPELDFDQIVEVQVVPARPWMVKRASDEQERGIHIEGEAPTAVACGHEIEYLKTDDVVALGDVEFSQNPDGITEFDPGDGTWRVVLSFSGKPSSNTPLPRIPDEPELGTLFWHEEADLVLPPIDIAPPYVRGVWLEVDRVTVQGTWPPGASVTVARVWRGATAVPSAEAVSWTRVKHDGTLSFPRIAGEPGATLRMRVVPEEGEPSFHEVVVARDQLPTPRLGVRVRADGRVQIGEDVAIDLLRGRWQGDDASGRPRAEYLDALASLLLAHATGPENRDEARSAILEISLRVDADAPWRLVQWVLEARTRPKLRTSHLRLALADAPAGSIAYGDSPPGFGTSGSRPRAYTVRLGRDEAGGPLRSQLLDGDRDVDLAPYFAKDRPWAAIAADMVALHELRQGTRVAVEVPPPGLVTFAEVFEVLDALDKAKLLQAFLGGAPQER